MRTTNSTTRTPVGPCFFTLSSHDETLGGALPDADPVHPYVPWAEPPGTTPTLPDVPLTTATVPETLLTARPAAVAPAERLPSPEKRAPTLATSGSGSDSERFSKSSDLESEIIEPSLSVAEHQKDSLRDFWQAFGLGTRHVRKATVTSG